MPLSPTLKKQIVNHNADLFILSKQNISLNDIDKQGIVELAQLMGANKKITSLLITSELVEPIQKTCQGADQKILETKEFLFKKSCSPEDALYGVMAAPQLDQETIELILSEFNIDLNNPIRHLGSSGRNFLHTLCITPIQDQTKLKDRNHLIDLMLNKGACTYVTDLENYKMPLRLTADAFISDNKKIPDDNVKLMELLLSHLAFPTLDELNEQLNFCINWCKQEKSFSPSQFYELLNYSVSRLTATDTHAILSNKENRIKFEANLQSLKGTKPISQDPKAILKEITLEGWEQNRFLPFRIRNLFEILVKLNLDTLRIEELPNCSAKGLDELLTFDKQINDVMRVELLTQIRTLHTELALDIISSTEDTKIKECLQKALTDGILEQLHLLPIGGIYCFPVTWCYSTTPLPTKNKWAAHAIYVSFIRSDTSWLIQIDNLGQGCNEKNSSGVELHRPEGTTSSSKTELRYPCILKLPLEIGVRDILYNYLLGLIKISTERASIWKRGPKKAIEQVYAFTLKGMKLCDPTQHSFVQPAKEQITGNCTVRNHSVGMKQRLNQLLKKPPTYKEFYHWLISQELALITHKHSFGPSQAVLPYEWWQNQKKPDLKIDYMLANKYQNRLSAVAWPKILGNSLRFNEENFVPRQEARTQENYIATIGKKLSPQKNNNRSRLAVCYGMFGVGKTQLAVAYFNQESNPYQHYLWCLASSRKTLIDSYVKVAEQLSLSFQEKDTSEDIALRVKHFLENHPGWLLVLDDAPEQSAIHDLLPSQGGDILVTTQSTKWEPQAQIKMEMMTLEEATKLVTSITKRAFPKEKIMLLLQELGRLPLALAQASAYIAQEPPISIEDYLEYYKQEHAKQKLMSKELPDGSEHLPLIATWELLKKRLLEKAGSENLILQNCLNAIGCLDPQAIPFELLVVSLEVNKLAIRESLNNLISYSLLQPTQQEGFYAIHNLPHGLLEEEIEQNSQEKNKILLQLLKGLTQVFTKDTRHTSNFDKNFQLLYQVEIILKQVAKLEDIKANFQIAELLDIQAYFYSQMGLVTKSIELFKKANQCFKSLGVTNLDVSLSDDKLKENANTLYENFKQQCDNSSISISEALELYISINYSYGRTYFYTQDEKLKLELTQTLKWVYEIAKAYEKDTGKKFYHQFLIQCNALLYLRLEEASKSSDAYKEDLIFAEKSYNVLLTDISPYYHKEKERFISCHHRGQSPISYQQLSSDQQKAYIDELYNEMICYLQLARTYQKLARLPQNTAKQCQDHFQQALKNIQKMEELAKHQIDLGKKLDRLADYYNTYADILLDNKNPTSNIEQAIEWYKKALDQEQVKFDGKGKQDFPLADAHAGLASAYYRRNTPRDLKQAEIHISSCIEIRKSIYPEHHKSLLAALSLQKTIHNALIECKVDLSQERTLSPKANMEPSSIPWLKAKPVENIKLGKSSHALFNSLDNNNNNSSQPTPLKQVFQQELDNLSLLEEVPKETEAIASEEKELAQAMALSLGLKKKKRPGL